MPSRDDLRRQSAERARALLARLDIQPPADFEARVLARVNALQAKRAAQEMPPARPLPCQRPSRGWRRVCWPSKLWSRLLGRRTVAYGLVVASAALLWCVSTRTLPTALLKGARQAPTLPQDGTAPTGGYLHGSRQSATTLQDAVVAAEPAPQPSTHTLQSPEAQMDQGDRVREGVHAAPPETPMTPNLPVWNRNAPKLSVHAPEQWPGRQHGLRGKAKRSGKGLRPSRYVPA